MTSTTEATRLARCRRRAAKLGYRIEKHGDEFRLIDTELSAVATYPAEIDLDTLERELFSED